MFRWRSGNDSSGNFITTSTRMKAEFIEIDGQYDIHSVACLADGKHIVSGDDEWKIRRWRVKDGKEVGEPMDAGSNIRSIAVSRNAKQIVSGTLSGLVTVWDAKSQARVVQLRAHSGWVCAVDISPDGVRFATGSDDWTVRVWSLSTGALLLGPWQHDHDLAGVRFSPDGLLIATATWQRDSIRVYDSQNGDLLIDVPIRVNSALNETLAWGIDSKQLFVLSGDGNICCLEVSTGVTSSRWRTHDSRDPGCISLASHGKFIAASDASSVSFWDTVTHKQIGSVIRHIADIRSMAISTHFDLVMGGGKAITLRNLGDILPSRYLYSIFKSATERVETEVVGLEESLPAQDKSWSASIATLHLIHVSDAVLESWRKDNLLEAIDIMSQEKDKDQRHHVLAARAFLRARLRQWDSAIKDAQKSIAIRPTILAYIAISMARFGRGNSKSAKEVFSRLFLQCDVDDVCFITLIKVIVMFTFGHHPEGMTRVSDLIVVCPEQYAPSYRTVQAQMHLIAARACIGRREYVKALELLADLQDPLEFPKHAQLECISLMFGWTNDSDVFRFTFYQQRCEALYALGRQQEATGLLGTVLRDLEQQSDSKKEVKEWARGESVLAARTTRVE